MTIFQNRITEIITSDPRLPARLGEYGHRVIEPKQHRRVDAGADGPRLTRCYIGRRYLGLCRYRPIKAIASGVIGGEAACWQRPFSAPRRVADDFPNPDVSLELLTLFTAHLILLIGRAGALWFIRFWLFGLLGRLVFALGHCVLLFSTGNS
jgi:hypothetical protein